MLMVPIEQAEPGMKLVMTVTHPEQPEQELLRPGYVLDTPVLKRLRDLGIPFLYIDYPDLADLDKHLLPHLSPARQKVYTQIKATIAAVQKTARPTVAFPDYYASTRELVLTLLQNGEHPIYLDLLSGSLGSDAVSHATAVAQLAVTLGLRLQAYLIQQRSRLPSRHAREVVNLGVAGMLHDIGKTKLPEHLQHRTSLEPPDDPADRRLWEEHPRIGGDMLRNGVEPSAVATVVQHHQHYDASGFPKLPLPRQDPQALDAQRIHVFARILLVADLYDRLTVTPGGGRRRWPIEILHLLRTQYWAWIDPVILRVLPSVVPPFPPGSRLTLSDGSSAVVTAVSPNDPYSPTVKRIGKSNLKVAKDSLRLTPDCPVSVRALGEVAVEEMVRAGRETPAAAA